MRRRVPAAPDGRDSVRTPFVAGDVGLLLPRLEVEHRRPVSQGDLAEVDTRPGRSHRPSPNPCGKAEWETYIRGKTGVIELAHGEMIYPDSAGNGQDEGPEHVYTVLFTNEELRGAEAAEPNGSVTFDVWEPYIVPAVTTPSATQESAA